MVNLCIKSFVNPFVDIALTLFDSSSDSFLLNVTSFSSLSKSVFLTKLALSLFLARLAYFSLAVKFSDVDLLNS